MERLSNMLWRKGTKVMNSCRAVESHTHLVLQDGLECAGVEEMGLVCNCSLPLATDNGTLSIARHTGQGDCTLPLPPPSMSLVLPHWELGGRGTLAIQPSDGCSPAEEGEKEGGREGGK